MWAPSLHQVPSAQSASALQPPGGSQVPLTLHAPERHTVPPVAVVHVPSPLAMPHLLSAGSQTPLTQTSVAAAVVHVPLSVGLVWVGSFGTAVPFVSLAVQVCALSRHQVPPVQSPSTLQPPAGSQVPFTLHAPDRHTVPPFAAVQVPSPLAMPHRLSVGSQTPLAQTSVAAAAVQAPFSVGLVWGGSFGRDAPFASLGVQACVLSAHQLPPVQSPSTLQPPMGSQVPFTLQAPDRHTVPPVAAVQGPSPIAKPHLLSAVSQTPLAQTSAAAAVVHVPSRVGPVWGPSVGIAAPLASFAVQVWVVSWHHWPPVQSPSTLQPPTGSHTRLTLHAPERHTVPALLAEHGPSPLR
jgi:hypothetical protein